MSGLPRSLADLIAGTLAEITADSPKKRPALRRLVGGSVPGFCQRSCDLRCFTVEMPPINAGRTCHHRPKHLAGPRDRAAAVGHPMDCGDDRPAQLAQRHLIKIKALRTELWALFHPHRAPKHA